MTEDQIQDLEIEIKRAEERLCEISVQVMEAKVAIEVAEETHKSLLTERSSVGGKLGQLYTKLEYAKDGLL